MSEDSAENDAALGWPRATIYGNYVAPALSSRGGGRWHIQGDEPDLALCGKRLTGDLSRMNLHVSLLECSRCMSLGESVFPSATCPHCGHKHTPDGCTGDPTPSDLWAGVSVEGCDCDYDFPPEGSSR